ncbi:MAG TPA: radical SAM family heme chaperone HemW [Phycisphaerales bacterium]|nr:radical SAM family heme chaperone HemW [Phycisphaerales bacterium]
MPHLTLLDTSEQTRARAAPRVTAPAPLPAPSAHPPVRALYIHVPFCVHKCHYCDFYSITGADDRQRAFTDRLIDELAVLAPHAGGLPLRTIFVGGGTPTLLHADLWAGCLLPALHRLFDLSAMGPGKGGEFTVECNPETASSGLFAALAAGGVNRISVGAQSFDRRHLKTLERWHDPDSVPRALELARAAGIERQSLDLIFGIPGQTAGQWERDLRTALALGAEHLSCYALTYEPGTALAARARAGAVAPADEDQQAELFEMTGPILLAAGLERYEISNFARPDAECRHNLAYWRQEQWLAAGPSASAHLYAGHDGAAGSWRWKNVARLGDYLASGGPSPALDVEPPDPPRFVRERLMTGIRLREGLWADGTLAQAEQVSPGAAAALDRAVSGLRAAGLVAPGPRWRLTAEGLLLADSVAAELMGAVT